MLECIEIETGPQPRHSVIWLHGLGADGHDFEPIVPELVKPGWPSLRFVFPHAPVRPITMNGGMRMRGWYDIYGLELMAIEDEAGILASVAEVERLLARERQRGVDSHRILLAGFSQGGAVALAAGLTQPERLAGIVALSTYLPIAAQVAARRAPIQAGLPLFVGHGAVDPIVPQALGLAARQRLQDWGHTVDWHSYGMPHSVCAEEIRDLSGWMERHLLGEQR
ncbi:MAG: carboxylesterase [Xanthomonadales bacterium]|nr:carboxylesterase [Xanthomonadales bacterium]